jgi:NAD(P)-dependent dehydrogenase (short-subunit alcohol dehydrogenase family)
MLTKLAVQAMRNRRSGRIVSISSIGVKYAGSPQTIQYSVSKAALESGTLALAKEAASYNVLINVLRAGITRTPVHDRLGRDMEARVGLIPLKRVAEPSEIARVVLFLVSPHNTYLTGAIIPVAGGE